jgi:hypothetical protein
MDDLNPADFTVLQPYLDSVRVKRGLGKQVLDDASSLLPGALVLFKDNGNVCSTRHVTAVSSIHETYLLGHLVKNLSRATYHNKPWEQQKHSGLEGLYGNAGIIRLLWVPPVSQPENPAPHLIRRRVCTSGRL